MDDYNFARLEQAAADSTILNEVRLPGHAFDTLKWTRTNPVRDAKGIQLEAGQVDRWLTSQEEEKLLPKTKGKLNGELEDIVLLDLNTGMSQEGDHQAPVASDRPFQKVPRDRPGEDQEAQEIKERAFVERIR